MVSSGGFTSQHRFAVFENRQKSKVKNVSSLPTPRNPLGDAVGLAWPASRLQSPQPIHLFVRTKQEKSIGLNAERGEGYLYKERWGGRTQLRHGAYYPVDQRSKIKELTGTEKNGRKNGGRSCKISGQVALGA